MAKKKPGEPKVPATAEERTTRHARIELSDADYHRLKTQASSRGLSVSAYIRQAVLVAVRNDEREDRG